jgi:hypothetical protein
MIESVSRVFQSSQSNAAAVAELGTPARARPGHAGAFLTGRQHVHLGRKKSRRNVDLPVFQNS